MLMKVYGGTTQLGGQSLCETCTQSRITRGPRAQDEIVLCRASTLRTIQITFKVTDCSEYVNAREPSYFELFDRAWILHPDSKRRPAGFVRACDLDGDEAMRLRRDRDDY